MNMIQSAKDQIVELTQKAYAAAVQEKLLPEGVATVSYTHLTLPTIYSV